MTCALILCILLGIVMPSSFVHCKKEYLEEQFEYLKAVSQHQVAALRLYTWTASKLLGLPHSGNQNENSQQAKAIQTNKPIEDLINLVEKMKKLSTCTLKLGDEARDFERIYFLEQAQKNYHQLFDLEVYQVGNELTNLEEILKSSLQVTFLVNCKKKWPKEYFEYVRAVSQHQSAALRLYRRMASQLSVAPKMQNQTENSQQESAIEANKTMEELKNLVKMMNKLSACTFALDEEVRDLETAYFEAVTFRSYHQLLFFKAYQVGDELIDLEKTLNMSLQITSNKLFGLTSTDLRLNASGNVAEGIIFGTRHGVFSVSFPSLAQTRISDDHGSQVAFDRDSDRVYWIFQSKYGAESIKRANLDGTELEVVLQVKSYAMAVDSITGNIYYHNATSREIRVCSRSGENCSILATNQTSVKNIVVCPSKRLMFWTNSTSTVRANMDGTDAQVIQSNKMGLFAVDEYSERFYWIALDQKTARSCDFNGNDERVVLNPARFDLTAIAFFGDGLYFGRYISHGVTSINKHGRDPGMIANTTAFIQHMAVYGREKYSRSNPCASSPCSHVCVLKLGSFACLCSEGKQLDPDGATCV